MIETSAALPEVRRVATARGTVALREAGQGTPLVLLHGIGSGSGSWAHQLASLSSRYRVIAWDAPGYGASASLASESPSAADYAQALGAIADALGLRRFHLLGHSLGALIAAAFAADAGERVVSLTLANAASGYGSAAPELRAAKIADRIAAIDAHGAAGLAERRAHALLSPAADARAVALVRAQMAQLHRDGYAQAARMLGHADIFPDAGRIAVPTLVLCGTADTVTPEANVRRIADAIPGARYVALPGLGHASYVEGPAAFDAALLGFLAEHPA